MNPETEIKKILIEVIDAAQPETEVTNVEINQEYIAKTAKRILKVLKKDKGA